MENKKILSTLAMIFLVFGIMLFFLPETGGAQSGCCTTEELGRNFCKNQPTADGCTGTFVPDSSCVLETGLCEGSAEPTPLSPVPTLSEWGLIATASIFGILALIVIRRRKSTA